MTPSVAAPGVTHPSDATNMICNGALLKVDRVLISLNSTPALPVICMHNVGCTSPRRDDAYSRSVQPRSLHGPDTRRKPTGQLPSRHNTTLDHRKIESELVRVDDVKESKKEVLNLLACFLDR